jgi:large subunit ribosomal protein L3
MGAAKVTVKNIEVIEIREKENIMLLKGAVPGARNSILTVYPQQR